MRKSRYVSTLLLAGAAVALSACGDDAPQEVNIFSSVEACVADGRSQEACQKAFDNAIYEHAASSPRYTNLADCEKDTGEGACQSVQTQLPDGRVSDIFLPMMVGYMMAEIVDEVGDAAARRRYSRPLYADRNGFIYSGDREVSRFQDNCNPHDRNRSNCSGGGGGGSAYVRTGSYSNAGASSASSTAHWSAKTTVAKSAVKSPSKPAGTFVSSRSSGGFGGTGGRASFSGGG